MLVRIEISCSDTDDLARLAKMLAVVGGTPHTVSIPPGRALDATPPAPPTEAPPVVALREPPPPTPPETRAAIDAAMAKIPEGTTVTVEDEPPQKRRGRPPGSGAKQREAQKQNPVPRPAEGYGKQTAPADPADAESWAAERQAAKAVLKRVLNALLLAKHDHEKFLNGLFAKYGDGFFSTVPNGNFEALLAEAVVGPKDCPLTPEMLDASQADLDSQQTAGAAT